MRAAFDHATTQGVGNAAADFVVVWRDEAPFEHVDQDHLQRGGADIAGNRDVACRQGGSPAAFGQRGGNLLGHVKQLEAVEDDHVIGTQQAQLPGFQRAGRDFCHRGGFEGFLDAVERVAVDAAARCTQGKFLEATTGRQQADARFDKADVAFQRGHSACRMHLELAAAAKGHAAHGGNHRHQRILDAHAGRLEIGDHGFELGNLAVLDQAERALEIGTGRERLAGLPDDHGLELLLAFFHARLQAIEHGVIDRIHLGLERDDADVVAEVPQAHAVVFPDRGAGIEAFAKQRIGEQLAPVDRRIRTRHVPAKAW